MTGLYFDTRPETAGWRPARWVIPLFSLAGIVLVPPLAVLCLLLARDAERVLSRLSRSSGSA